jgi:hypothetical protein
MLRTPVWRGGSGRSRNFAAASRKIFSADRAVISVRIGPPDPVQPRMYGMPFVCDVFIRNEVKHRNVTK